jgi:hypothetical protein
MAKLIRCDVSGCDVTADDEEPTIEWFLTEEAEAISPPSPGSQRVYCWDHLRAFDEELSGAMGQAGRLKEGE